MAEQICCRDQVRYGSSNLAMEEGLPHIPSGDTSHCSVNQPQSQLVKDARKSAFDQGMLTSGGGIAPSLCRVSISLKPMKKVPGRIRHSTLP